MKLRCLFCEFVSYICIRHIRTHIRYYLSHNNNAGVGAIIRDKVRDAPRAQRHEIRPYWLHFQAKPWHRSSKHGTLHWATEDHTTWPPHFSVDVQIIATIYSLTDRKTKPGRADHAM